MSWQEKFTRLFGPGLHTGTDLRRYFHQLKDNRFRIHPRYATRLMAGLQNSAYTSIASRIERRRFGEQWSRTNVAAPLFILGHWRSGTTHLHNLLATDSRFATPNLYQVMYPHIFLTTEQTNTKLLSRFLPKKRFGLDNMPLRWSVPYEDEFAIAAEGLSMFLSWSWPQRHQFYDRFMTMNDVSSAELQHWKNAWMSFLQKLTLKYQRPLILKSPPHTARIKLILELFPDAKFVHVHRHPYDVFRSRQRLDEVAMRGWPMQAWKSIDWNQRIIGLYNQMFIALLEQLPLIPDGNYHEIRYEDLEQDPVQTVKSIYESLSLPNFEIVAEDLRSYVDSIAHYRKNDHSQLPAEWKRRIDDAWERFFHHWGYDFE